MGLLNDVKKDSEPKELEPKELKKHSNSEYQKKQRELAKKFGLVLKEHFNGTYPNDAVKEAVEFFAREKKAREGSVTGPSVFEKLFGKEPKKGMKVPALDMLKRTGKGFNEMNKLIAKWREKDGNVVEFNEEKLEYTLVELAN